MPRSPFSFPFLSLLSFLLFLHFPVEAQYLQLDPNFRPGLEIQHSVIAVAEQDDQKILFGTYRQSPNIFRLLRNGKIDPEFKCNLDLDRVDDIKIQPDGKILLASDYPYFLVRLNPDGSLDESFQFPGATRYDYIFEIEVLKNGKILIGGKFDAIGNDYMPAVARLHADGSLDTSFHSPYPPNTAMRTFIIDSNQHILISGQIEGDASWWRFFNRLKPDGAIDSSFQSYNEVYYIYDILEQADGKIIIGGPLREYSGKAVNGLARLWPDGSLDSSFKRIDSWEFIVYDFFLWRQESLFINGGYSKNAEQEPQYLVNATQDGTLNPYFTTGSGPDDIVWESLLLSDGRILIGGDFENYNGQRIQHLAVLNDTLPAPQAFAIKLFPNPFDDQLEIEFVGDFTGFATARLMALDGQMLKYFQLQKEEALNLAYLKAGLYIFEVIHEGKTHQFKILKK